MPNTVNGDHLSDVDDIDWRTLRGARPGSTAECVPLLLSALANKAQSEADCKRIEQLLDDELLHCGMTSEAVPYAIPFLARLILDGRTEEIRATAVGIVVDVAAGEPDLPHADPAFAIERDGLRRALEGAVEALYSALSLESELARQGALGLVFAVEGMTDRFREALDEASARTTNPHTLQQIAILRESSDGGTLHLPHADVAPDQEP